MSYLTQLLKVISVQNHMSESQQHHISITVQWSLAQIATCDELNDTNVILNIITESNNVDHSSVIEAPSVQWLLAQITICNEFNGTDVNTENSSTVKASLMWCLSAQEASCDKSNISTTILNLTVQLRNISSHYLHAQQSKLWQLYYQYHKYWIQQYLDSIFNVMFTCSKSKLWQI